MFTPQTPFDTVPIVTARNPLAAWTRQRKEIEFESPAAEELQIEAVETENFWPSNDALSDQSGLPSHNVHCELVSDMCASVFSMTARIRVKKVRYVTLASIELGVLLLCF